MAVELIRNGSFETGTGTSPANWTGSAPGRVDRVLATAPDGSAYYALGADSVNHGGYVQQTIATEIGKTYTLNFRAGISTEQSANTKYNATMKIDFMNGATIFKSSPLELSSNKKVGFGDYTYTFTATSTSTTIRFTDNSPNGQTNFDIGLDKVSVQESPSKTTLGAWSDVQNWPIMAIHSVVTQDGKVLTFGTDKNGVQGSMMYHDLYDPVTRTHQTIDHSAHTATDIFCSAALILPGTDKILISGGDARPLGNYNGPVDDSNYFSSSTKQVAPNPEGEMWTPRWYNTMVSLSSGQVINLGGSGSNGLVEIFTEGEGWRKLPGATDRDVGSQWWYPRAWVGSTGEVFYFAAGGGTNSVIEVMALDPSGQGSIRQVGQLPFSTDGSSPAIMYDVGKTLIMASNGQLWTMDITGNTPVFKNIGIAVQDREYSNMTLMADGKVLINGGGNRDMLEVGSVKSATIWDPDTGGMTTVPPELYSRLYHSTSILLTDGTIMSSGGGAGGAMENNYLNAQFYKPPYLFDANGNEAVRPKITDAPKTVKPGETFTITLDNAASINKLTFIKSGATTHTLNMDTRSVDLEFTKGPGNTLQVKVPDNANDVTAGSWMLFAWNDKGVPSIAPMVAVAPTLPAYDGIGDITAEYFQISTTSTTLEQVNLNAPAIYTERVSQINESGTAAWFRGGPTDDFGIRFKGDFMVDKAGAYTFYLTSDDGARLSIDGKVVTQTTGTASPQSLTQTVNLTKGAHKIELVYIEIGGNGQIDLDWAGPGFGRTQMTFDGADNNLIDNGAFEARGVAADKAFGWTTTGSVAQATTNSSNFSADGGGYIAFGGNNNATGGGAQQTIATVAGQTYTLTFAAGIASGTPAAAATAKMKADVLNGATSIASQDFTLNKTTGRYDDYSITFTATGAQTVIKLTNTSSMTGAAFKVGVDSVVVEAGGTPTTPVTPTTTTEVIVNGMLVVDAVTPDTQPTNGTLTKLADGKWLYKPNAGFQGSDSFTHKKTNAAGQVETVKTVIDVKASVTNKAPVVNNETVNVQLFDGANINVLTNDSDPEGGKLTVYNVPGYTGTKVAANGDFQTPGGTPANPQPAVPYLVVDDKGAATQGSITINPSYYATPVAVNDTATVVTGKSVNINVLANDTGGGPRGIALSGAVSTPANGAVTQNADGTFTYTPKAGFTGTDTFQYGVMSEGSARTLQQATVTVNVTADPTTPVTPVVNAEVAMQGHLVIDATTPDTKPTNGILQKIVDGKWLYQPTPGFQGTDSFTYKKLNPATGKEETVKVNIAVKATPDNKAPVVTNETVDVHLFDKIKINVLANDRDPEGGKLTVYNMPGAGALDNFQSNGDVEILGSTPANPRPSPPYLVVDDKGAATVGTVVLKPAYYATPVPVNDTATVVAGKSVNINVLANDTGGGPRGIELSGAVSTPANGTVTKNADGTFTYTPKAGFTGTDTFQYGVTSEGSVRTLQQATVTVTVTADPGTQPGTNTINGTSGNDYIVDTNANDIIRGGDGMDVIALTGRGDDIVDGEGGSYNQVDLNGKASDYTFTRNPDGSITVKSAAYGTDLLKNIHGFWFYGENKWYTDEQLAPKIVVPGAKNTINGTAGNDYLFDTDADDIMLGGDGQDIFELLKKGNDIVDGQGGAYNQVNLAGKASDYTFARNSDGSMTVSSAATGTDTLKNIQGFWFHGEGKWYGAGQLASSPPPTGENVINADPSGGYYVGTDGNDRFNGGKGNDVFVGGKGNDVYYGGGGSYNQVDLSGKIADWDFRKNGDGSYTGSHAAYGQDTFHDISAIWFGEESAWKPIDDLVG